MSLCDVQARLRDRNPNYVRMFTWTQEGNTIKAVPHKYPSNLIHKTMLKTGFKHVSYRGASWYELTVQSGENHGRGGGAFQSPTPATASGPESVLKRLDRQLVGLRHAGKEWLGEQ